MAFVTTNAPAALPASAGGFLDGFVARFMAWRAYRKTVAELSALSDRELDDIGLIRAEIPNYARQVN